MFAFRIDIDSSYGLVHGVPKILELLDELKLKASFYCVLGGETGAVEALTSKTKSKDNYSLKGVKLPKTEMARIALLPHNFALKNKELLKKVKEKHEVGVHGWKHREWTKSLDSIDLSDRFTRMNSVYEKIFGVAPTSFSCPGFNWNKNVLKTLNEFGYTSSGDLNGNNAFTPVIDGVELKCVQVPVNCKADNTMPLIEYYHYKGLSDNEVVEKTIDFILSKEEEFGYSVFYCHDLFEGVYKTNLLKKVLKGVLDSGIKRNTIEQIAKNSHEKRVIE
ncbi:polysaccharide deacetylase family protein [Candidatus Micrarchaeota archaeon]|nr:polysaccharide deacetylase family protein [Candidatus Micrarchaeota archaeon]